MDPDQALVLLKILAPTPAIFTSISLALLLAPLFYVIVRWRANREQVQDPQVGIKFVLHYFAMTAFQMTLFGVMVLLYAMISSEDTNVFPVTKSEMYRSALGLMVPGGLVLGGHIALIRKTNDDMFHNVRRLMGGFNLLLTGLIGFLGLVLGFQALFAKGSTHGMGHLAGSMILVYGAAWVALLWWFGRLILGGGGFLTHFGAGMQQPHYPMPMAPPPSPSPYTALPPLGGYPPPPEHR